MNGKVAICVGCGCDDNHACSVEGLVCAWAMVDRVHQIGVCTFCDRPKARETFRQLQAEKAGKAAA